MSPRALRRILILLFPSSFLFLSGSISAQQTEVDSLNGLLKTDNQDTSRIRHLIKLGWAYYDLSNGDSSEYYFNEAIRVSEKSISITRDTILQKVFVRDKMDALTGLADLNNARNLPNESLKKYQEALVIALSIHDVRKISFFYGYVGYSYYKLLNYPEAIRHFKICISYGESEKNKDIYSLEKYYNILGNVYLDQGSYSEAASCYFSSLKLAEQVGSRVDQAYAYANLCTVFENQKNYTEANKYISLALKISLELKDSGLIVFNYTKIGEMAHLQNRLDDAMGNYTLAKSFIGPQDTKGKRILISLSEGNVYFSMGKYDAALKCFEEYKGYAEERGDSLKLAAAYGSIANVYTKQKNYAGAEKFIQVAISITKRAGYKLYLRDLYNQYSILDSAKGDFRGAFENHKLYMVYSDSLSNDESMKKILASQMNFDFEKKEAVADAEHKKELEKQSIISEEKTRNQQYIIWSIACGFLMVLVFAGIILRSLRVSNKQKKIIVLQKEMVEEKQKEVLDSIHYAKRIQQALLPNEKYIDKNLARLKNN